MSPFTRTSADQSLTVTANPKSRESQILPDEAFVQSLASSGGAEAAVVRGTRNADVITVQPGDDVFGEEGDDIFIVSGDPNARINGGEGRDTLNATITLYQPVIFFDLRSGSGLPATTYSSIENLGLQLNRPASGTAYEVNVFGTGGANVININAYMDGTGITVNGTVRAGAGDDYVYIGAGNRLVAYGGDGNDTMNGGFLYGEAGDDVLNGTSLDGGDGDDILTLEPFFGGAASGGAGIDTLIFRSSLAYTISVPDGRYSWTAPGQNRSGGGVLEGIERFFGNQYDDSFTLGSGAEYAEGNIGNDILRGGGGDDILYGDIRGDTRFAGNDQLFGDDGDDMLFGQEGNDTLSGGAGSDRLSGGPGTNTLDGGAGDDVAVIAFNRSVATITYEQGVIVIQTPVGGTDRLTGIEAIQFLDGVYAVVNGQVAAQPQAAITGTANADRLNGTANADVMSGGAGNDLLRGRGGNDIIDGGEGVDTAQYGGTLRSYSTVTQTRVAGGEEGGYDTLSQIEALRFLDGRLSFDTSDATSIVYRLYDAAFDRAPDVFGLADYARALSEGRATVQSILDAFAGSAEFQARYGAMSNEGFVAEMYRFSLNRGPDDQGMRQYVDALNAGTVTRAQVLGFFSESAEHQTLTNAFITSRGLFVQDEQTASVARLYDSVFNRLPDLGGLSAYRDALDNGYSLKDIAAVLVASPEFQTRFGNLTNQQFVEQIYRFVLDREGDAGGIQSYVTALNNGASRTDVVLVLSESQEHRFIYQATFDSQIRQLGVNGYDPNGSGVGRSPLEDNEKHHDAFVIPTIHDDASVAAPPSFADDLFTPVRHGDRMLVVHADGMDAPQPGFWPEDIRADAFTHHSDWV